ncbi:MAG: hypothetical protein L0H26_12635, partial [Microlunatus sp.]|nr:hypothetical protein [Microlunatus sp.]
AQSGYQVTVLERDRLPSTARSRRGVPQGEQAHVLLHRGLVTIDELLPGFRAGLLSRGAMPFDTGQMPWLGEFGWLDTSVPAFEVVSATRPLMEAVARERLLELPMVSVRDDVTVSGLVADRRGWRARTAAGEFTSDIVVDASGRSSRLEHWLPGLGRPRVEQVDAQMGYACRLYAERVPTPLRAGVMILNSPMVGTAGLALPVEGDRWLVAAAGFGDKRPPRDEIAFERFLADLPDPGITDLVSLLDPAGPVRIYRQTANQRRRWDRCDGWPRGLLVVGDALCAFNPVYGQGITVAAQQASAIRAALGVGKPIDRLLQRQMIRITDTPWSMATTADLRHPSCPGHLNAGQRLSFAWASRLGRLAAAGDVRCTRSLAAVNHLMVSPVALFHPALVGRVARPIPRRRISRPRVLEDLSQARSSASRRPPPAAPTDA